MSTIAVEKRRFPRKNECVCTWLTFKRDRAAYGTTTVDLGMGGACFITSKTVEVGEDVWVCLQLPWMNVQCNGMVCWQDSASFTLGVRFLDLRDGERDFLRRYLWKNEATTATPQTEMMAGSVF